MDGASPDTAAEPGTPTGSLVPLGVLYVCAVFGGPVLALSTRILAFGLFASDVPLDDPAAIQVWLALAIAPVIGVVLGWRAHKARGSRVWFIAPVVPFTVAVIAYVAGVPVAFDGSRLAVVVWAALYAFGPVILGRLLALGWTRLRARRGSADAPGQAAGAGPS